MRRIILSSVVILLCGASLFVRTTRQASADLNRECFAQTGHCLMGNFLSYWQANGSLPVFGYPITAAADEYNRDTGQWYLTQWLERNRLEVHPENAGTPYEILLGLLGKQRLNQLNRAPDPREVTPKSGCLWFEETGHNVCNQQGGLGFKTYWESHGLQIQGLDEYARSLQLFGFPLTEPRLETNANGDTVLTQWFERARFEWHPGNPNEFKVLLGLLGKEILGHTIVPVPPTDQPIKPTTTNQPPTATKRANPTGTQAASAIPTQTSIPPTHRPSTTATAIPATATVIPATSTIVLPTDLPTSIPTNTIVLP